MHSEKNGLSEEELNKLKEELKVLADKKKKLPQAEKIVEKNPELFEYFISLLSTNKNCQKAAKIVLRNKRKLSDFPDLVTRLSKKGVRYLINNFDWEMLELRLRHDLDLLAIAAEDLLFHKKLEVFERWIVVFPELINHIKKLEAIEEAKAIIEKFKEAPDQKSDIKENLLLSKDSFGKIRILIFQSQLSSF